MVFRYRDDAPFGLLLRIAQFQLEELDEFLRLASDASSSRRAAIRARATDKNWECLMDEYSNLERIPQLASELAIVGLWRTVESFRRSALIQCEIPDAKEQAFKKKFVESKLKGLRITEGTLRCSRTVDELRCLNNSVKHSGKVGSELAGFRRWKEGERLGDLEPHYWRLRPVAERYLSDLGRRLAKRWLHLPNKALRPHGTARRR